MKELTNAALIDHLRDLIQLDYDASLTYEEACDRIADDDHAVTADLVQFRHDHERHIVALTALVVAYGGTADAPKRDFKGAVLEGMTALRSMTGTLGALKAMRTNEKRTNSAYEKAGELPLPPDVLVAIMEHLDDERRHLAAIETHVERIEQDRDDDAADRHEADRGEADRHDAALADRPHVRV